MTDKMFNIQFGIFVVVLVVLVLGSACFAGLFVSPDASRHLLQTEGFTNIHLVQKHIFLVAYRGCSDKDNARFDYIATNPLGKRVSIHVCDGILKGATIRG